MFTASGSRSPRFLPSFLVSVRYVPFQSLAFAVGHAEDEDALASVWRADFLRSKQSERAAVTTSRQVLKDEIEAEREVACDVLEEDSPRSKRLDESVDGGPEMTMVVVSQSLPGMAEWLARVAP